MPTPQQSRENAVREARALISTGAHYLTGTFGARPGETDIITGRALGFISSNFDWRNLAINAAEFGGLRCCGRYRAVGGRKIQATMTENPPNTNLGRWLQQTQSHPEWDYVNNPRMSTSRATAFEGRFWPRRHSTNVGGRYTNWVYLGESCAGKMHFDCVGFVCFVYTRATGKRFWVGLNNIPSRGSVIPINAVAPGDLIHSRTHVAIVETNRNGNISLIHANGDQRGVERTPYNPGGDAWNNKNPQGIRIADRHL